MEQSLYIFWVKIVFIFFLLSIFYTRDYQLQGIFALISSLFFFALVFVSLDVVTLAYDPSLSSWIERNEATYTLEAFIGIGMCLILAFVSFFHAFQIFMYKGMEMTTKKLPKRPVG